jgi:hypothetical protein
MKRRTFIAGLGTNVPAPVKFELTMNLPRRPSALEAPARMLQQADSVLEQS